MKKIFLFVAMLFVALSFGFASGEGGSSDSPVSNFTSAAFSVSADKQVYFSPGNLQYIQSSDTWQFASCQWECVGTDNVTGSGTALADKIDLFGWSTSTTNFGVSTSTDNNEYIGFFVDWGSNKIGADAPNTWRTLTCDEWYYLLFTRPNASSLKGVAQVNGVNGLIFLPDIWSCPAGVTFRSGFQTFTADQWSKMEVAGAVFLPAAGGRIGSGVHRVQNFGYYWSATVYDSSTADFLYFRSDLVMSIHYYYRYHGLSVRLVKDL